MFGGIAGRQARQPGIFPFLAALTMFSMASGAGLVDLRAQVWVRRMERDPRECICRRGNFLGLDLRHEWGWEGDGQDREQGGQGAVRG